ncbi:hypothetical protein [Knoellia koreensis]|uniref:Uncharacterized protein n=1 Tax=Knoellia koreensis TaxID=2730921 RepID=A0A849HAX8_9MICO|nr:hypothetical protein [Knoellia sp. DB2414S]NNM44512.1 hypothetical protein [Knoellia sp. DB2414S]
MRLHHYTNEAGARGIEARGFAVSHVGDSAGRSWFTDGVDSFVATGSREWRVTVEIPDDVAEAYRYRFEDGTPYLGNYLVPWEVVNAYRPFTVERLT